MISSYGNNSKTIASEGAVTFDVNRIVTGCTITHAEGTPSFKLNKPGYYFVIFNGDVTGATGDVVIQLTSNGVAIPGSEATTTLGANTDTANISFSSIIKVLPSCTVIDNLQTLVFVNAGVEATFTNVNVIITKLC